MTELAQYDEVSHSERSEESYELPPWRRMEFAFGKSDKSPQKKISIPRSSKSVGLFDWVIVSFDVGWVIMMPCEKASYF